MKTIRHGILVGALAAVCAPATAQTPATDPSLSEDVAGIRRALERLVVLLETFDRHHETDLLLARIALHERRMAPLERRLREAEAEVEGAREQLATLERMEQQHEAYLDDEIKSGKDAPMSETRRMLEDIRRSRTGATERQEEAYLKVQRYENELAVARRELDILDEMLAERLEPVQP